LTDVNLTELTADIVSGYVAQNTVAPEALPDLIRSVYGALDGIASGDKVVEPAAEPQKPAISIKKSITPDYLISLEDGRQYKSLKRHLRTAYNMSPEEYRAKWGLPRDYPMVAPAYAASRSALAKSMGLGRGGAGRKPIPVPTKTTSARKPRAPKA
jgi:predicted transcriptional regulator